MTSPAIRARRSAAGRRRPALRALQSCAAVMAALAAAPGSAHAQRLDLTVTPLTISFPSADPDTLPVITSAPVEVTYRVRGNVGPWSLTLLATGDLISGGATVDISSVSWVASPAPPFQDGTLSKTVAQPLASGSGMVNPSAVGSVIFRLNNSWTYSAGTYTQTLVFTLSAP